MQGRLRPPMRKPRTAPAPLGAVTAELKAVEITSTLYCKVVCCKVKDIIFVSHCLETHTALRQRIAIA